MNPELNIEHLPDREQFILSALYIHISARSGAESAVEAVNYAVKKADLLYPPAAVDEAKVSAAFSRLARNEYGDPRTAAANRSRDIRAVRDSLATKPQGGA